MNQVPDRQRLRREYLRKKRRVLVCSFMGTAVMIAVTVGVIISTNDKPWMPYQLLFFLLGYTILVFGGFAAASWPRIRKELNEIPYVPAVTLAALPADEILVRGSQEPAVAQNEVLLRAANEQETPKEQLLRIAED